MWLKIGALGLALLNVVIGLLTLLPVHPLDGHKLVVGLVWWAAGSEARAERIVKRAGFGFLAVDVSVGMFLLQDKPFIGLVIVALAATAYAQKHLVGRPTRF
jgi:Zn-dependent protease